MTSLRQRVSTYFRQLSFIAEPHRSVDPRFASTLSPRNTPGDGCFMTKYLEGQMEDCTLKGSKTEIFHGKEPADLPDLPLRPYDIGPHTVVAACTGPDKGLTTVKRSRMHLSLGDDIDFIDTPTEDSSVTMTKPDRNANKEITNETKVRPRRLSKSGSQADESTTIHQMMTESRSSGKVNITVQRWTMMDNVKVESTPCPDSDKFNKNVGIRKKNVPSNEVTPGAIINCHTASSPDEYAGITNWQMENDNACGISISLYEKNIITQESTGTYNFSFSEV
ncbi:PP2C-like domain-containing protein CG9801 [Sitodiplosis mosellana]|uniref:PP2C-like domain-containing protein CG9801 n=1 Tax=Sitodiplosis mosellana TaxID=263140 RepID=UPI002443E2CF|nr:PP2C-like domain-containing protein CG9801 [Sitodiplosis mosellana]